MDFLYIFGEIDDEFIDEAAPHFDSEIVMTNKRKKRAFISSIIVQIAACIVILCGFILFLNSRNDVQISIDENPDYRTCINPPMPAVQTAVTELETSVKMPLVIINQTFAEANPAYETGIAGEPGGGIYYIKKDGNLYYRHYSSWDLKEPDGDEILAAENVRSVYGCEVNSYAQFYIKNDNSLWGFGDNSDNRFGGSEIGAINTEAGFITRENAVKLMDDVANFYEISDNIYVIKTDKSLWKIGSESADSVNDYTDPINIAVNVVEVYEDGFFITENGDLYFINDYEKSYFSESFDILKGTPLNFLSGISKYVGMNDGIYVLTQEGELVVYRENDVETLNEGELVVNTEKVTETLISDVKNAAIGNYIAVLKTDNSVWIRALHPTDYEGPIYGISAPNEFMKIIDEAVHFTPYCAVTADGEIWRYNGFATTLNMDFVYVIPEKSGQLTGMPKYAVTADGTVVFADSGDVLITGIKLPGIF
jgi:hypothetical protein